MASIFKRASVSFRCFSTLALHTNRGDLWACRGFDDRSTQWIWILQAPTYVWITSYAPTLYAHMLQLNIYIIQHIHNWMKKLIIKRAVIRSTHQFIVRFNFAGDNDFLAKFGRHHLQGATKLRRYRIRIFRSWCIFLRRNCMRTCFSASPFWSEVWSSETGKSINGSKLMVAKTNMLQHCRNW